MRRMFLTHSWRAHWRGLVVFALIIGAIGAPVLASVAGARRSATALDRFHEAAQTSDVFIAGDVTTAEPPALLEVLDGPLVESTNDLVFLLVDVDAVGAVFAPTSRRGLQVEQGVLLEGRRADPDEPDEVAVSETVASDLGLGVGDTFAVGSLDVEQAEALLTVGEMPTSLDGPQVELRVVGITRNGFDARNAGQGGAGLTVTTPAFWEEYGDEIGVGSRSHLVRLVDEPDALERFTTAVERAYEGEHLPSINVGRGERIATDSIAVITAALVAVAVFIAAIGVVWIGSATARHQRLDLPDVAMLRALGASAAERRVLLIGCVVPALVGGAVLAPLLAVALSPLFPVGAARRLDPGPGVHVDAVALLAGSAVLVAALAAIAALSAARLVSRGRRPSEARVPVLVDRAARSLEPAAGTGVRFALHAPSGASAPVRPALAGAVVGVIGLVAVAVVGASLQRLVDTPARWGTTWDVAVDASAFAPSDAQPGNSAEVELDREALLADPDIEAAAVLLYDEQVTIEGVEAISMTIDPVSGGITPTVIEGHEPRADDEIAVARDTLHSIGADLGATVTVRSRSQVSEEYRIVGVIAFPTIGEPTPVATGATLTAGGGDRLLLGDATGSDDAGTAYVVIRWAPGVDGEAALARWGVSESSGEFEVLAAGPTSPPEVRGLDDVQQFPLLVGAVLVVLGVLAVSHALIVTVRRRSLELGVLSVLGFAPSQRRVVILAQATTIAAVALVLGIPLGAAVGGVVWSAIAGSMGLGNDATSPLVLLAVGAIGVVLVLNTIAAVPARTARRLSIADALRSE